VLFQCVCANVPVQLYIFFQIMRIHGKAFDDLTRRYDTHISLQRTAGGAYCFPQFIPTLTDSTRTLLDLLVLL
jgi:hypothetical protein